MRRLWVVSYDVADDRRRQRLADYLLGWGDRVLESVFECVWRADQLPQVQQELAARIEPREDRLWLVPVCRHCRVAARVNGQRRAVDHCSHHVV
ncbi:CRISPR-associated endonuclease Cas2 [Caldimonas tepidiphila]|uniref:CRISPR-associated endonuclease Cas2 n=1 Tax=Caldimonas tepidiphila TaxID=2315841 RepID=UPI000E5C07C6|nr:CRISPR-associated endonuclease Cas2 [Caldimonas tepidiphila]